MVADCPSARGPANSILVAIPLEFVCADADPETVIPGPDGCQVTVCPLAGIPLESTNACTVQVSVAPAARESRGVSERRVGGVPPAKCACRLEPFESDAVTTAGLLSAATAAIVALPSPVAMTLHTGRPHARAALPLATV